MLMTSSRESIIVSTKAIRLICPSMSSARDRSRTPPRSAECRWCHGDYPKKVAIVSFGRRKKNCQQFVNALQDVKKSSVAFNWELQDLRPLLSDPHDWVPGHASIENPKVVCSVVKQRRFSEVVLEGVRSLLDDKVALMGNGCRSGLHRAPTVSETEASMCNAMNVSHCGRTTRVFNANHFQLSWPYKENHGAATLKAVVDWLSKPQGLIEGGRLTDFRTLFGYASVSEDDLAMRGWLRVVDGIKDCVRQLQPLQPAPPPCPGREPAALEQSWSSRLPPTPEPEHDDHRRWRQAPSSSSWQSGGWLEQPWSSRLPPTPEPEDDDHRRLRQAASSSSWQSGGWLEQSWSSRLPPAPEPEDDDHRSSWQSGDWLEQRPGVDKPSWASFDCSQESWRSVLIEMGVDTSAQQELFLLAQLSSTGWRAANSIIAQVLHEASGPWDSNRSPLSVFMSHSVQNARHDEKRRREQYRE